MKEEIIFHYIFLWNLEKINNFVLNSYYFFFFFKIIPIISLYEIVFNRFDGQECQIIYVRQYFLSYFSFILRRQMVGPDEKKIFISPFFSFPSTFSLYQTKKIGILSKKSPTILTYEKSNLIFFLICYFNLSLLLLCQTLNKI